MESKQYLTLILASLFLASCGPNGFPAPISNVNTAARSTYIPPQPQKNRAGDYEYYQGLSQISDLKVMVDGKTRQGSLNGAISIQPNDGSSPVSIHFDLKGQIDDAYTSLLLPTDVDKEALAQRQSEIGAKLTCLYTDCSESFVDIYVRYKGVIYHHQVDASGAVDELEKTTPPKNSSSDQTASEPAKDKGAKDESEEVESEPTEDHDHADISDGYYIGTREADLGALFPTEAKEAPAKTTEPKKETDPKKESQAPQTQTPAPAAPENGKSVPAKRVGPLTPIAKGDGWGYSGQAIGKPFRGRLVNATDLFEYTKKHSAPGFRIMYPEKNTYFGTDAMMGVLAHMGYFSKNFVKGYDLSVNAISGKNGGVLRGHKSHQTGLDVDMAYYFSDKDMQPRFTPAVVAGKPRREWMVEEQWSLYKYTVKMTPVDRIFIAPSLKKSICELAKKNKEFDNSQPDSEGFQTLRRLIPEADHVDHFHLRVRQDCPLNEPRCFQMVAPPNSTNCSA